MKPLPSEKVYIEELKKLVLQNIDCAAYAIFLFGGRARGRQGKAIDVDIGFLGKKPLSINLLAQLYDKIEESSIPYKVDLIDFYSADSEFKTIALKDIIIWNQPPTIEIS